MHETSDETRKRRLCILADTVQRLTPEVWAKAVPPKAMPVAGKTCLMLSFGEALRENNTSEHGHSPDLKPREAIFAAIDRQFPERVGSITQFKALTFNDHPDTTLDDVHLVLAGAARLIAAGEIA